MSVKENLIFLIVVLFLQSVIYIIVLFDVPVIRQVIGFLYFTFVPGFVIMRLLKLNKLDTLETIILSVGLSIAFLMLIGLVINEFGLLFQISRPLSLTPLLIILNSFIILVILLAFSRSGNIWFSEIKKFRLHSLTLALMVLPVLSILGAMWLNIFGSNSILLIMLIAISILFICFVVSKKFTNLTLYSFAVLLIAVSLLYHASLVSKYIVVFGSDIPVEYFVFKTTQINAYWDSELFFSEIHFGRINSMLSVTILPTVYSNLLGIDGTWMVKLLFPVIFSFVPLGLYQMWRKSIGEKYAFISTFFFMSFGAFYGEILGLIRQITAELFFVSLLLIILNDEIKPSTKRILFMIFSFGLITSHYGLSIIFIFFIFLNFILLSLVKRSNRKVTLGMVILFFALMFTWYIYTSGSATFNAVLEFGHNIYGQLGDFFNPSSRGETVLKGLGLERPPTIWNAISRTFAYITEFLIVIGFVGLITKQVKFHFNKEYLMLTFTAIVLLSALLIVPGLANTMNMTRFYHVLLFFLAPLCVIGIMVLVKLVSKQRNEFLVSILSLIVLVPYFLFQTGFIYEVTQSESWSISLSGYRMGPKLYISFGFATDQEVLGARWLSQYAGSHEIHIHVDTYSRTCLLPYGMIPYSSINYLSNVSIINKNEFVYLGKLNTFYGKVFGTDVWNITDIKESVLDDLSILYSNGICQVYTNNSNSSG